MTKIINSATLKSWLDSSEAILIDVRENDEYAASHIEQALHIPLAELDIAKLPAGDKKIVFQCKSGMRSGKACQKITEQQNDREIYSLEGGISAWESAGLPTVKGESTGCNISINQQVHIAIGIIILLCTTIGMFFASSMLVVNLLIGCALIFSGISGWCGMAILLTKMPWNKKSGH